MPKANSESMQHHLDLIAATITAGKHAVLAVDRAAWHVTEKLLIPVNLSILPLPPYSLANPTLSEIFVLESGL